MHGRIRMKVNNPITQGTKFIYDVLFFFKYCWVFQKYIYTENPPLQKQIKTLPKLELADGE